MRFLSLARILFCALILSTSLSWGGTLEDGDALLKAGKPKEAESAFTAAIQETPAKAVAYVGRARARILLKDVAGATRDLDQAIAIAPKSAEAFRRRSLLRLELGQMDGAIADMDQVVALAPTQAASYRNRAGVRLVAKDYNGAVVDSTEAIRLDPGNAIGYAQRAQAWEQLGESTRALADYDKTLSLDPKHAVSLSHRAALRRKAGLPDEVTLPAARIAAAKPTDAAATDGSAEVPTAKANDLPETPAGLATVGVAELPKITPAVPAPVPDTPPAAGQRAPEDAGALSSRPPVAAAEIPPFLDINRITPAQFAGAVSFAMESMRLVYGELTAEQEKKFEAKWRPLFQFCTPQVIEYFNKLNPLLGQFLQIRDALSAVAAAFDEAQQAAATAVAVGSAEELARAMDAAELSRREMQTLNRAMEKVVDAIVALGDPPDAEGAARRRRKVHEDALASVLQPAGEYLRIGWEQPPAPWVEELYSYGRGWHLPAPEQDRYMILNPPGSGPGDRAFRPYLSFWTNDEGGVANRVRLEVMFERYPDMGTLQPGAENGVATNRPAWMHLTKPSSREVVPGSTVIEETHFAGYDAIHFVREYCSWQAGADGDWTRYEWYAVDFGSAKESRWLLVSTELAVSQHAPDGGADEFRKRATASFLEDWAAIKNICLTEQANLLDSLTVSLTGEIPKDDAKRFVAPAPLGRNDVPFVRDQLASGVWQVAPDPWNDVREGSSASSLETKQELGTITLYNGHSWTAPPPVMHVEDATNIDVTASVRQVRKKKTRKLEPGEAAEYPFSDTIWASDTDLSISFHGVGSTGARAFAKIEKVAGPNYGKKSALFAPGKPLGTGFTGRVTIDCARGSVSKNAFDDGMLSQNDEEKRVASWSYFWNWEPTAKVTYKAGAGPTAGPTDTAATAEERKATAQEAAAKLEQIEFYKAQIAVQQSDLDSLVEQRGAARPEDRAQYDRRIMWAHDWIQRARDSITTLQTGNFTRTRTAADEFNLSVMASESSEMALRWDTVHRLVERGPRLIALAPYQEQDKLREFFDNQVKTENLASGDPARFKKVMAALGDRVMGSLEQAQAKSELELINVEEGLKRRENLKAVAQTELMLLSMGGGWLSTGFAAIQGVSGYVEGGPGEAAKQVLRSYNRATMAASDAMDAYQKSVVDAYEAQAKDPRVAPVDEVRAGLGGAGWVLAKAAALEIGMKYAMEPLGRYLLNIPKPPAPKTMKEIMLEMQHMKRRAEGMAIVETFQNKMSDLSKAAKAGASADQITRLQAEAETVYKVIKTDWFAKMHVNELGRRGNALLVRQYNVYDNAAMTQLKTVFEKRQENSGFAYQQYKLFSNSASSGKAGIDVDLGVVEPPRMILNEAGKQIANPGYKRWLENLMKPNAAGNTINVPEFRKQSKENLEAAFQQVYGYDPKKNIGIESFLTFTTSSHPEAYRDLAWLGKKGMKTADFANVDPAWAGQAASVTGYKIVDLPTHHPAFGYFATLQEQSRGIVKDFDSKLAPLLWRASNKAAVKHIESLRDVMDQFARNKIGPVEANRLIMEMTGGKGICEVQEQYAVLLQALAKPR